MPRQQCLDAFVIKVGKLYCRHSISWQHRVDPFDWLERTGIDVGVKVAGTLPAAIQSPTIYAAALVAGGSNDAAARAYVRSLTGAEGRAAITQAGIESLAR